MKKTLVASIFLFEMLTSMTCFAGFDEGLYAANNGDFVTALYEWGPLADQGNADAQNNIGKMYANGQGVPQDHVQAIAWYRKAADQGNSDAQNNLGNLYANGKGVLPIDFVQALTWYRKAADLGNAVAQNNIGNMHANGQGVPQNHSLAVAFYRKAADQENADAQNNLGNMYANGTGIQQDYVQALEWYRKAADQDHAGAQNNLGELHAKGQGVQQDNVQAMGWFRKAADQGNIKAQNNLGVIFLKGNNNGVTKDYAQAAGWFRRAADQGNSEAQTNLGAMYYKGVGVTKDYAQAAEWLRKAADQGNTNAQTNMGTMHFFGNGVPLDYALAAGWFRKAADQGNVEAQLNLGKMYASGKGLQQDYQQAVKWYRLAAEQGQPDAKHNLALLHEQGLDIPPEKYIEKYYAIFKYKFGFWGYLLLILFFISLLVSFASNIKHKKFISYAKLKLTKRERCLPNSLITASIKAYISIAAITLGLIIFTWLWIKSEYLYAIATQVFILGISGQLLFDIFLIEKLCDSINEHDKFFTNTEILKKAKIIKNDGIIKNLLKTKNQKNTEQKEIQKSIDFLFDICACLEATEQIKVIDLSSSSLYFYCKTNYFNEFCNERRKEQANAIEKIHSVNNLKKLTNSILKNSQFNKNEAFDFIVCYYPFGDVFIDDGRLGFFENPKNINRCSCCGQYIDEMVIDELAINEAVEELYCSDICRGIDEKLQNGIPDLPELGSRIADIYAIQNAAVNFSNNHKLFTVSGRNVSHGFAAERANTYIDEIKGNDSKVVGDDNRKLGPDRIVNGQEIQTKYCKTAARSLGAVFDGQNGNYKYISTNGKMMPVEVPKDQYDDAVRLMEDRIKSGRVPGVKNPSDAKKLVVKGGVTYQQSKNICKFGTIEGFTFDIRESSVNAGKNFGVTFCITFAQTFYKTGDINVALTTSLSPSIKSATKSLTAMVLTQQLQRLEITQAAGGLITIPNGAEKLLAKGFGVSNLDLRKQLRGTAISTFTIVALSSLKDVYRTVDGKITSNQLFKNTMITTSGVVGGLSGAAAGKALGAKVGFVFGGPIGAFLGGVIAGQIATSVTRNILDKYIEDDLVVIQRIVKLQLRYYVSAFMLTDSELDAILDYIKNNQIIEDIGVAPGSKDTLPIINAKIFPCVVFVLKNRPPVTIDMIEQSGREMLALAA